MIEFRNDPIFDRYSDDSVRVGTYTRANSISPHDFNGKFSSSLEQCARTVCRACTPVCTTYLFAYLYYIPNT